MKKTIALILTVIMMMSLCACGSNNPEAVTEGFMNAVKDQNKQELIIYAENPKINVLANNAGSEEQMAEIFSSIAKNLMWEILSVEENDEKTGASVKIKISNSDFSGVLATYQTEAVKYTIDNFASEDFTKETMTDKCISIYAQHVKAAAVEDTIQEYEVEISLVKDENDKWQMEVTDELVNAVLGGLQFPL